MTEPKTATPDAEAEAKATAVAKKDDKDVSTEEWMQRAKSAEGRVKVLSEENAGVAGLAAQINTLTSTVQGVVAAQSQTQNALSFLTETINSEELTPEQVTKRDALKVNAEKQAQDNRDAILYRNQITQTLKEAGITETDPLVKPVVDTFNRGKYAEAAGLATMINIVKQAIPQAPTPVAPPVKPRVNPVKTMTPESKSTPGDSDGIVGKARIQREIAKRAAASQ